MGSHCQVGSDLLHVVQRVGDSWVGKQGVDTGEDRVELGQHLLHRRQHGSHPRHESFAHVALDGVACLHTLARVVGEQQVEFDVAEHVGFNLRRRTLRQSHLCVEVEHCHIRLAATIVEDDVLDDANLISVGIHGAVGRQAAHVVKLCIVSRI